MTLAHHSLIDAVTKGDLEAVIRVVENNPEVVLDHPGQDPPLYFASIDSRLEVASYLLDHGADINARFGAFTPLHFVVETMQPATVDLLLSRGADPTLLDAWARRH